MHKSVLLDEAVDWLVDDPAGTYVDCTLGGGGHALAIAGRLSAKGVLVGIDQDEDALKAAAERLKNVECRLKLVKSNFSHLSAILEGEGLGKVNGVLFDLGVSSYQLDTPERGFSYMQDGLLDMRMDRESELTAGKVVNDYPEKKLADIIWRYGEERWAKRIAQFIVTARQEKHIDTTAELVTIIKKAVPKGARQDGPHPAKRTFQAIRIEVNNELGILENVFTQAVENLVSGGRIAIITFHSLEDRIAKQTLTILRKGCQCPPSIPVCVCGKRPLLSDVSRKVPDIEEIEKNPRARSAKLRMAIKI